MTREGEISVAEEKKNEALEDETTAQDDTDVIEEDVIEEGAGEEEATETEETSDEATEADEASDKDEASDTEEQSKDQGAKFFKKKDKKDKKDAQIEELTDKVKRQMAEFENFRKRTEKEKSQMYEVGAKSILEKILPVVDNFERGLNGMEESDDPFAQGMQMIYKQLMTSLEEAGVTTIEAVGQEFNPEFHNAVMHVEDEAFGENEVIEEFQKGYLYRDSVIRHSMVKVAN